jgi:hypothetical protein
MVLGAYLVMGLPTLKTSNYRIASAFTIEYITLSLTPKVLGVFFIKITSK